MILLLTVSDSYVCCGADSRYYAEVTCSGGTKDLVVSVVDILSADWQHLTDCWGR
jgi:hypothetical protein